jgi:ATP synthase D chain, mitochondrial (ATP5H)
MSSRPVVAKIDWNKLTSALSLTPHTTSSLTSFRKRNVDAHTKLNTLRASRTEIDFSYYRSLLKNQAVVDQIERAAKQFKPATYDVGVILKGIDGFEAEAVKNAEDTEKKIAEQMVDLEETVKNIDQSRHPDELSVCPLGCGLMVVGGFAQGYSGFTCQDTTDGAGGDLDGISQ